jgi:hypothetical protein
LMNLFSIDVAGEVSHDELQALVSGLAGLALSDGHAVGVNVAGVPPIQMDGTWREDFIVNPTLVRHAVS